MTHRSGGTADYLLAEGRRDAIAVVDASGEHSYGDVRSMSGRVAAALAGLALEPGARVGLLGANSAFWVASYLAVLKLGLVAVPLSDRSTPEDVRRNVALVRCGAVLGDRRSLRRLGGLLPPGLTVLTEELLAREEEYWPDADIDPGADAVLMFTSGTTARPKAVRVTHRNIRANTDSIIAFLGLERRDRALVILPFFYCYGASLLHTHLRVGGRLVLCNSFAFPETAVDLLERQECTVLAGVPSSFQLLLRTSSFASRALPSLRVVQQAGGKLAPALIEELAAAVPGSRLYVMYGQTEATARLSFLPPERLHDKLASIGRGIPGVELRVLDEDGHPVAPGQRGEIYARGANVSPGYFEDPVGTAEKFTPLGLRTGDVAVVDEEGFIYVVDRRDDFIKSWGYRISGQEIEACALHLAELVSAAAVGVPDDEAGEAVVLAVTTRPGSGTDPGQVLAHCRQHLPKHMVPRSVVVVDAMPLNGNGKIDKAGLRALLGSGDGSAVPASERRGRLIPATRRGC